MTTSPEDTNQWSYDEDRTYHGRPTPDLLNAGSIDVELSEFGPTERTGSQRLYVLHDDDGPTILNCSTGGTRELGPTVRAVRFSPMHWA